MNMNRIKPDSIGNLLCWFTIHIQCMRLALLMSITFALWRVTGVGAAYNLARSEFHRHFYRETSLSSCREIELLPFRRNAERMVCYRWCDQPSEQEEAELTRWLDEEACFHNDRAKAPEPESRRHG